MTDHYTVHPWRHASDLLPLRTALYHPSKPAELASALSRIRAWKLRGSLPHAIDSTGALLEAQCFHRRLLSLNMSPDEASFPVRATYMAALARFVTGYADIRRHRTGPARSMAEVARDISLPHRFVEVRHEAAHEDLPALPRLVELVAEALEWLWRAYWVRLEEPGKDRAVEAAPVEVGGEEWRNVLRKFRKARVKDLQSGAGTAQTEQLVEEAAMEIMGMAEGTKTGYGEMAKCLCTPGMLIPVATTISESDDRMNTAKDIWQPLLLSLAQRSRRMMKPFLAALTRRTTIQGPLSLEHRGLTQWLQSIFSDADWKRVLGARKAPLLSYTLQARIMDTDGDTDACEAVCETLIAEMKAMNNPDLAMWEDMLAARFDASRELPLEP